ncbi:septum formation family protein [Nocardioides insulae]|uniref:septum formation family protein n=1 Tax=Nocardioides insulae TaxID=394734 RepID=UPI000413D96C|nr:septum formation family protein [Nocardioides insulae]
MHPRLSRLLPAALALGALGTLNACTEGSDPEPEAATTSAALPPPVASPAPTPADDGCYRLSYEDALAPTTAGSKVPCGRTHTSQTFATGTLDAVVDGHLLAVDSTRVRDQVATTCPDRLPEFLGGDEETMRLTMLRSVWFTPTLEQAAEGAQWYRCDVVAVTGGEQLADLDEPLDGVLAEDSSADPYAMCGTAAPDSEGFQRVLCGEEHSWRALNSVDLVAELDLTGDDPDYPGQDAVREAGQDLCADAGEAVAEDALDFEWGYEWPDRRQWRAGQTYGLCWAPD